MSLNRNIQIARKIYFSSAHFYKNPEWSDEKNREVFGACFNPYGHGHNYTLEAVLEGQPDPVSGLVVNLVDVDRILKSVVAPLDHRHLNFEIGAFQSTIPTTENMAIYLYQQIQDQMGELPVRLMKVRLYEEEGLWVDYPPVTTEVGPD